MRTLAQMMAPMTPHLAEEVWSMLGGEGLVINASWPKADPALLVDDEVTMPIQVNGKRRRKSAWPKTCQKKRLKNLLLRRMLWCGRLTGQAPRR